MLNKNVSSRTAITVVVSLITLLSLLGWSAAREETRANHFSANECTVCHRDAKTLAAMKDKRGD